MPGPSTRPHDLPSAQLTIHRQPAEAASNRSRIPNVCVRRPAIYPRPVRKDYCRRVKIHREFTKSRTVPRRERSMARKQKNKVSVELPPAFVKFMRHVHQLIDAGAESATLESDDLLQCDCAYGGLYDASEGRFDFRYLPDEDSNDRTTWDLDLDAQQIAAIAAGSTSHVDLWQCSSGNCKCFYEAEDAYCMYCDSIRHFDDYESQLRFRRPDERDEVIRAMLNLRQIGLAILDYHGAHGHFPKSYTVDSAGRPLHSWRSLILPYLDCDELFAAIDFDKPWDAEANRLLWDQQPDVYRSEEFLALETRILAIVDEKTIWPLDGLRAMREITSGYSYTVAAIQSAQTSVHWMQPTDIDMRTAEAEYASLHSLMAVFVDGHVDIINDVDIERLRQLICV
jgi:hypothetical protein